MVSFASIYQISQLVNNLLLCYVKSIYGLFDIVKIADTLPTVQRRRAVDHMFGIMRTGCQHKEYSFTDF